MKRLSVILLLAIGFVPARAQLKLHNATLGFNYNGGQRVPIQLMSTIFDDILVARSYNHNTSINRVFSDYGIGFSTQRKNLYWDASILQGTEYFYSYQTYDSKINDTLYTISSDYNVSSSLVGLRASVRINTPTDKRFFAHYSVGVEGLLAYDMQADGNGSRRLANSRFIEFDRIIYTPIFSGSYSSANLVQNIGFAFKFGKDETKFPLNKVYIESDFQLLNNFTIMKGEVTKYRTFGLIIALGYQF